jgi:hypothetical protein
LCWCIVVLVYCCVGALLCWCIVVLVYSCVGVLSCWCIVVLVYCCVGDCRVSVLSCWCIVVLVYCPMYIPDLPNYLVVVGLLYCYVVGCTYLIYLLT